MNIKQLLTRVLLAFVLITIGFALGKETTLCGIKRSEAAATTRTAPGATGDKLIVYYMHASIRCVTCNSIERMTRQLLESKFAEQLKSGRIECRTVNFQKDEDLARRYDIASSGVVLVSVRGGRETGFRRLDDVWQRADDPAGFETYVGGAIASMVEEGER